jgi:DNA-nicking Smr family endonuclease
MPRRTGHPAFSTLATDWRQAQQAAANQEATKNPATAHDETRQAKEKSDADLWRQAMANTIPLPQDGRASVARPKRQPPIAPSLSTSTPRARANAWATHREIDDDDLEDFRVSGIARKTLLDLRRGYPPVSGELDLHGMTRETACIAIDKFLREAVSRGWRAVRLISGKGHQSADKKPVLRPMACQYLRHRPDVLAFCTTPEHKGGTGALLILLRHHAG